MGRIFKFIYFRDAPAPVKNISKVVIHDADGGVRIEFL